MFSSDEVLISWLMHELTDMINGIREIWFGEGELL
jgi:hypothetical protein